MMILSNRKTLIFCIGGFSLFLSRSALAEGSSRSGGTVQIGPGNFGVNRVIRTYSVDSLPTSGGYTGVQATVDIRFTMPKNENTGNHKYELVDENGVAVLTTATGATDTKNDYGTIDADLQPFYRLHGRMQGNKPSAYLGGQFLPSSKIEDAAGNATNQLTQIDAGLQYEPATLFTAEPGWAMFLAAKEVNLPSRKRAGVTVTELVVSPRVKDKTNQSNFDGVAWRVQGDENNGNALKGNLTLLLNPTGSTSLNFTSPSPTSSLGTFYANLGRAELIDTERWSVKDHDVAPWSDEGASTPKQPALILTDMAAAPRINLKRVTAMTRDDIDTSVNNNRLYSSELDGSRIIAEWSNCQLRPTQQRLWNLKATNATGNVELTISRPGYSKKVYLSPGYTAAQIESAIEKSYLLSNVHVLGGASIPNGPNINTSIEFVTLTPEVTFTTSTPNYSVARSQSQIWSLTATNATKDVVIRISKPSMTDQTVTLSRGDNASTIKSKIENSGLTGVVSVTAPLPSPGLGNKTSGTLEIRTNTLDVKMSTETENYILEPLQRGGEFQAWSDVDVDQSKTGYDVERFDTLPGGFSKDKRYASSPTLWSKYIVDFDPITVTRYRDDGTPYEVIVDNEALRTPGFLDGRAQIPERYSGETVRINLGMIARPVGKPLKKGP